MFGQRAKVHKLTRSDVEAFSDILVQRASGTLPDELKYLLNTIRKNFITFLNSVEQSRSIDPQQVKTLHDRLQDLAAYPHYQSTVPLFVSAFKSKAGINELIKLLKENDLASSLMRKCKERVAIESESLRLVASLLQKKAIQIYFGNAEDHNSGNEYISKSIDLRNKIEQEYKTLKDEKMLVFSMAIAQLFYYHRGLEKAINPKEVRQSRNRIISLLKAIGDSCCRENEHEEALKFYEAAGKMLVHQPKEDKEQLEPSLVLSFTEAAYQTGINYYNKRDFKESSVFFLRALKLVTLLEEKYKLEDNCTNKIAICRNLERACSIQASTHLAEGDKTEAAYCYRQAIEALQAIKAPKEDIEHYKNLLAEAAKPGLLNSP